MRICKKDLSPFQRRWLRTIDLMMGISIALSILLQALLERHNPSPAIRGGMAVLSIVPVIATILLVARYLRGEKDEYLRTLVVESLLWALSAALVADSFSSYFHPFWSPVPLGNISLDIFALTASSILEIKLWGNR
jgi:hypothetical protein